MNDHKRLNTKSKILYKLFFRKHYGTVLKDCNTAALHNFQFKKLLCAFLEKLTLPVDK